MACEVMSARQQPGLYFQQVFLGRASLYASAGMQYSPREWLYSLIILFSLPSVARRDGSG